MLGARRAAVHIQSLPRATERSGRPERFGDRPARRHPAQWSDQSPDPRPNRHPDRRRGSHRRDQPSLAGRAGRGMRRPAALRRGAAPWKRFQTESSPRKTPSSQSSSMRGAAIRRPARPGPASRRRSRRRRSGLPRRRRCRRRAVTRQRRREAVEFRQRQVYSSAWTALAMTSGGSVACISLTTLPC